ncbi:MAG: hydrogen peroxide-inducible genes activator [Pseudomonadota bacterium]
MSGRPTLRQLEYFASVVEAEHFGRAAEKVHATQPTLSAQIRVMEERLGTKLLQRGGSGVWPTPIGEKLYRRAREILTQVDQLVDEASRVRGNLGGVLRLGMKPTFGPYFMPSILPGLRERFPELELFVREDRPGELLSGVSDGQLDLALTTEPISDDRLAWMPLVEEMLLVGMAENHVLAEQERLRARDLKGHRMLTLGRGHGLNQVVQQLAEEVGAEIMHGYEGTSLDGLRQMVAMNMGISVFPALYARFEIAGTQGIVVKRVEDIAGLREVGLMMRKDSVRLDDYSAFGNAIREIGQDRFGELGGKDDGPLIRFVGSPIRGL